MSFITPEFYCVVVLHTAEKATICMWREEIRLGIP